MSQFARDTAVEQVGDGRWRGELVRGWRVGEVPNGGYVLAVAGRVLRQALPHPDPLTATAYYLSPTSLGPVDCQVEVLRQGRNNSFAEVKMYQQGKLKVKVVAVFTDLDALHGESWTSVEPPDYPRWQDCEPLRQKLELRERAEVRLVGGNEVFSERRTDGSGEFRGWMRHDDGADPDEISLLMFADAFPPPAFTVFGPVRWVPTLELTVQVRARPGPGPIQGRLLTRHLTSGVLEEDGEYWDSEGKLVALSRQSALIRV